jgi:hypothetical protein
MNQLTTQYRGEISIQQVIADMRAGMGESFFLQFVRTSGKRKGSIKTVANVLYGAPKRELAINRPGGSGERNTPLHTDKGTLPLTDNDTGEYITPLIATIITYNGYKVTH